MPRKYTATCRILIEPPAGADTRNAMALSPMYLESLHTYEHFAGSDSLFRQAIDHFHLREHSPHRPIESLKSEALRVAIVRDTEILEIRVTLPDPKTAHALAIYLADQTVNLNRAVNAEGEQERLAAVEKEEIAARARLDQSEAQWTRLVAQQPFEVLQQSIQSTTYLKGNLELQLLRAEMDASDPQGPDPDGDHARAKILRKQIADTEQQISTEEALLAHRLAERDRLTAERTDSQTAYAAVENRLRQVRADLGYHGERLRIIDPGVIPERPSSPSLIPNVFAAFLLGMVAAIVYLMLSLSYQAQRASARRSTLRLAAGSED